MFVHGVYGVNYIIVRKVYLTRRVRRRNGLFCTSIRIVILPSYLRRRALEGNRVTFDTLPRRC